jgi:glycosyltransferase involved in cell wall biosynthesis
MPDFSHKELFEKHNACVLMATFNNAGTIEDIIRRVLNITPHLIVVNDGSTDETPEILQRLQAEFGFQVHGYEKNRGKGYALRTGFSEARKSGYDYALTLDSDGQHFPEDTPLFLEKLEEVGEPCLILGNRNMNTAEGIPGKSSFGNNFSNFWFWVETGQKLPDTQTGFRLYPILLYDKIKWHTVKFEFEIEVLVRSAWRGITITSVPVQIVYFEGDERVSHFRPFADFSRISVLNTVLVTLALLWYYPRKSLRYFAENKPLDIIKEQLSKHNESKLKISFTMGFGFFMGIVPIWGFQMLVAFFLAQWMKLNKTLVILAANISLPPLIPFIVWGSFWFGGLLLHGDPERIGHSIKDNVALFQNEDFLTALAALGDDIWQYLVGAFALALVTGFIGFAATYIIISIKERVWKKEQMN